MTRNQPAAPQPPAAVLAPAAPGAQFPAGSPAAEVFGTGQLTRPITQADVDALRSRGRELSNQLRSAQGRRDDLARQLRSAQDGVSRQGLEQRMQVIDARLAQIETDIAANGRLLAAAPPALLATSSSEGTPVRNDRTGPFSSGQLTAVSIVFTLAVLMPMALAMARSLFKRAATPRPAPQVLESTARLERMEQAIDAIAVEVERISEGQRFVTQTLAKRDGAAALREGEQIAETIRVAASSPVAAQEIR